MKKPKRRVPPPQPPSVKTSEEVALSQKCDTLPWAFHVFVSEMGACDVQKAVNKLTEEASEELRTRIRYLANTPMLDWKRPDAAKMKGVDDVYEIRFKANNLQHRPFGYFGPSHGIFTILIWSTKKGSVTDPGDPLGTAGKRLKAIGHGASTRPFQLDGEIFPPTEQKQESEGGVRQSRIGEWLSEPDSSTSEEKGLESS
jgi:hypothetical protein